MTLGNAWHHVGAHAKIALHNPALSATRLHTRGHRIPSTRNLCCDHLLKCVILVDKPSKVHYSSPHTMKNKLESPPCVVPKKGGGECPGDIHKIQPWTK